MNVFDEKFVAPLLKRFDGDLAERQFGVFGGRAGRSEIDVFKAQLLVSRLAKHGWSGAPALYYESGGEIKIVQGHYRLLAAMALDADADVTVDSVQITDAGLVGELDTVSTKQDQRAVLFRSKYCPVFDQHEAERKAFYRPYKTNNPSYDRMRLLPSLTRTDSEVRAWHLLTGGCGGYTAIGGGIDAAKVGMVEVLGASNADVRIPCGLIFNGPGLPPSLGGKPFICRAVGDLRPQSESVYRHDVFVLGVDEPVGPFSVLNTQIEDAVSCAKANQSIIEAGDRCVGLDPVGGARAAPVQQEGMGL